MTDLLTHVVGVYTLLTPLTWRFELIQRRHVTLVMVGAIIPDISKIQLLIGNDVVTSIINIPWDWNGVHRLGPAGILAGVGALGFERRHRLPAFISLLVGVTLHFVFDLAVIRAGGVAPAYLYPFTWWQPQSMDLLLSSDVWPWIMSLPLAGIVLLIDRRHQS